MITFITWLRCLAAMLITNAHYTGIYPTDLIANGGLVGDILFFCVSGYCLTNLRTGFFKWYAKRVSRILPAIILISGVYVLLGQDDFSVYASGTETTLLYQALSNVGIAYPKWLSWFVYPTYYHFAASILVLYIPYYFILKNKYTRENLHFVMAFVAVVYLTVYAFVYDKSYYHIDTVREPFIRFLFIESMLLGAWFKLNDGRLRNSGKPLLYALCSAVAFVFYFASKIVFSGGQSPRLQIINQISIFILLFFIMRWFCSIDKHLEKAPRWLFETVNLIARLTLEIYLVQYVIIDIVRELGLFFPLNWVVLTAMIALASFLLHILVELIIKAFELLIGRLKKQA